ncbi:MAG: hypothetical protein JWM33_3425 [Caulobacteraceae bacterium]|nr:hypothetical protein [Caulobacteraceae bacterium]
MKHLLAISLTAAALALSACATPTVYAPASQQRGQGFSEQRIENGRYRVTFAGAGDPARINDLALRRAAELTLQDGYDWFRVAGRSGQVNRGNGPTISLGTGTRSGGYGYYGGSGVSLGLGTSFNLGLPQSTSSFEILMQHGSKPDQPDAYDARDVIRNIRT